MHVRKTKPWLKKRMSSCSSDIVTNSKKKQNQNCCKTKAVDISTDRDKSSSKVNYNEVDQKAGNINQTKSIIREMNSRVFTTRYVYNSKCDVNQVKYELVCLLSHVFAMCKQINRHIVNVSYAGVVKRSWDHKLGYVVNKAKAEFTHKPGICNVTKIYEKPVAHQMKRHTSVKDEAIIKKVSSVTNDNHIDGNTAGDAITIDTLHNNVTEDEAIQVFNTRNGREDRALEQASNLVKNDKNTSRKIMGEGIKTSLKVGSLNNCQNGYKLLYDARDMGDDKFINSIMYHRNHTYDIPEHDACPSYVKCQQQSKYKFGFVPLTEPTLPETNDINILLDNSLMGLYSQVKQFQQPNFMGARVPTHHS